MNSSRTMLAAAVGAAVLWASGAQAQDSSRDFFDYVETLTGRSSAPAQTYAPPPASFASPRPTDTSPVQADPAPACLATPDPRAIRAPDMACSDLGGPDWLDAMGVPRTRQCVADLMQSLTAVETGAGLVLLGLNVSAQNPDARDAGDVVYANPGKLRAFAALTEIIADGNWLRLSGCGDSTALARAADFFDVAGVSQAMVRPAANVFALMDRTMDMDAAGTMIIRLTSVADRQAMTSALEVYQGALQQARHAWRAASDGMVMLAQSADQAAAGNIEATARSWDQARGRLTAASALPAPDTRSTCNITANDGSVRAAQAALAGHLRLARFGEAYYATAQRCLNNGTYPADWHRGGGDIQDKLAQFAQQRTLFARNTERAADGVDEITAACRRVADARRTVTDEARGLEVRIARVRADGSCALREADRALSGIKSALDGSACLRQSAVKAQWWSAQDAIDERRTECLTGRPSNSNLRAAPSAPAPAAPPRATRPAPSDAPAAASASDLDALSRTWESSFGGVYVFRDSTGFYNGHKSIELERTATKQRADGTVAYDYEGRWYENGRPAGDWKGEVYRRGSRWVIDGRYNRYGAPEAWNGWQFTSTSGN